MTTPFLKYAGGKRQLLPTILSMVPKKFGRYFEPFVGSGAVFFGLSTSEWLTSVTAPCAWLSDTNATLMLSYCGVRDYTDSVIRILQEHEARHSPDYYRMMRGLDCAYPDSCAARMIYLNKTAFNGLYRVNQKGIFNVPMGDCKSRICDEVTIRAAAAALKRCDVQFHVSDFGFLERHAVEGDFVYMDPPYVPSSATADFTGYTCDGFTEQDQRRLADLFRDLSAEGVMVLASNSDTPLVRELYRGFKMVEVSRRGTISSKGTGRGRVGELLIQGWMDR